MQIATRTAVPRPWGIRRLRRYPATVKMPFTSVTVDPDTQIGVFRDGDGLVVEMGKHGVRR